MAFELDVAMSNYNTAVKKLQDMNIINKSSMALAVRRGVEQEYAIAARTLVRMGYLNPIKRKYRG
jgi:hypothetical protein